MIEAPMLKPKTRTMCRGAALRVFAIIWLSIFSNISPAHSHEFEDWFIVSCDKSSRSLNIELYTTGGDAGFTQKRSEEIYNIDAIISQKRPLNVCDLPNHKITVTGHRSDEKPNSDSIKIYIDGNQPIKEWHYLSFQFGDVFRFGEKAGKEYVVYCHGQDGVCNKYIDSAIVGTSLFPGFDCFRARSSIEHLICISKELAKADRSLLDAFIYALANTSDKMRTTKEQLEWLSLRAKKCNIPDVPADGKEESFSEVVGCLTDFYKERAEELFRTR